MSAFGDAGDLPRRWIDAWNTGDGDALASLYADEGSYTDMPTGLTVSGVPAITGFAIELSRNLVRDMRWELRGGAVTGDRAFVEWRWSATNTGLVPGDAALGRPFAVQGVTTMQLTGGTVARSADFYDLATIMRDLGLLPPLGSPG